MCDYMFKDVHEFLEIRMNLTLLTDSAKAGTGANGAREAHKRKHARTLYLLPARSTASVFSCARFFGEDDISMLLGQGG